MISPPSLSPSNSLLDATLDPNDPLCPPKTAFIHLHSLVSKDISLPCPDGVIGVVQQLLIDVVVYYELFANPKAQDPLSSSQSATEERERTELCGNELNRRLQFVTIRLGERLMESMMWAWLHTLLRSEKKWRMELEAEKATYIHQHQCSRLSLKSQDSTFDLNAAHRHITYRIEDIRALRRVTVFTFETLRHISTFTAPVYEATPLDQFNQPPAYSEYAVPDAIPDEEYDVEVYEYPHVKVAPAPASTSSSDPSYHCQYTNQQLESRLSSAEMESQRWKPTGAAVRRQSSETSLCSLSPKQGLQPQQQVQLEGEVSEPLDLVTDFEMWIDMPSLRNLRTNHRLERRHWCLEQLPNPMINKV